MGGAVLTETVFAWPGLGRLMVKAIFARDYVLLQGAVLVFALAFVADQPRGGPGLRRARSAHRAAGLGDGDRARARSTTPAARRARDPVRGRVAALPPEPPRDGRAGGGRAAGDRAAGAPVARPRRSGQAEPDREARAARRQVPRSAPTSSGATSSRALIFGSRVALLVGGALGGDRARGGADPRLPGRLRGRLDRRRSSCASSRSCSPSPTCCWPSRWSSALGPGVLNTTIAVGIWGTPTATRLVRAAVLPRASPSTCGPPARSAPPRRPRAHPPRAAQRAAHRDRLLDAVHGQRHPGRGRAVVPRASGPSRRRPRGGSWSRAGATSCWWPRTSRPSPASPSWSRCSGFNLLGDGLRDALDPRLRGQL